MGGSSAGGAGSAVGFVGLLKTNAVHHGGADFVQAEHFDRRAFSATMHTSGEGTALVMYGRP